jgi:AcrR family transcriptional regulator
MRKSADVRRREIVEAVLRLATEVGPDRLTTQAVADAVGLTQPAIFRHFANRETLWVEVAHTVAARMRAVWQEAEAPVASPEIAIRRLIVAHMGLVAQEPAILAIVFSHELRVANAELAAVFRGLMAELAGRLAALYGAAADRLAATPQDAALLSLGLVQGVALRWSLSGRGFDLVAETGRLLDLQLAGLIRPETGAAT